MADTGGTGRHPICLNRLSLLIQIRLSWGQSLQAILKERRHPVGATLLVTRSWPTEHFNLRILHGVVKCVA